MTWRAAPDRPVRSSPAARSHKAMALSVLETRCGERDGRLGSMTDGWVELRRANSPPPLAQPLARVAARAEHAGPCRQRLATEDERDRMVYRQPAGPLAPRSVASCPCRISFDDRGPVLARLRSTRRATLRRSRSSARRGGPGCNRRSAAGWSGRAPPRQRRRGRPGRPPGHRSRARPRAARA